VRVAIIGAGNVGSALARACAAADHEVIVSSRQPENAAKVAADVGGRAARSNRDAVEGADMVVLAVPSKAVATILDEVRPEIVGKIVVDPTNPTTWDYEELFDASGSLADAIQLLVPGARVVKAFNTILASRLNDPVVDGVPLDGFYAGDDEAAKATVAELLATVGFRPLDVGGLPAARVLELMAVLHIGLNIRNNWPWQSGWKLLGPTGS
jgi:8-hydroxy-5-deazaflavin:NADPH oxidoreductase